MIELHVNAENYNYVRYTIEKMNNAIIIFVLGEGNAKSRLREATRWLNTIKGCYFPEEGSFREEINEAYSLLTKYHDIDEYNRRPKNSPESIYDATLNKIRNKTASKIIGILYGVYASLSEEYHIFVYLLHNKKLL